VGELDQYTEDIGKQIDKIEAAEEKGTKYEVGEHVLRIWKTKINGKKSIIEDIESDIRGLRRKWNKHLVDIEDTA
jgi:hypothetical protein